MEVISQEVQAITPEECRKEYQRLYHKNYYQVNREVINTKAKLRQRNISPEAVEANRLRMREYYRTHREALCEQKRLARMKATGDVNRKKMAPVDVLKSLADMYAKKAEEAHLMAEKYLALSSQL